MSCALDIMLNCGLICICNYVFVTRCSEMGNSSLKPNHLVQDSTLISFGHIVINVNEISYIWTYCHKC